MVRFYGTVGSSVNKKPLIYLTMGSPYEHLIFLLKKGLSSFHLDFTKLVGVVFSKGDDRKRKEAGYRLSPRLEQFIMFN